MGRTITHRELRNNSSRILEEVKGGATITVTNRGEVTAVLVPPDAAPLRLSSPRNPTKSVTDIARVKIDEDTMAILDELRDEGW